LTFFITPFHYTDCFSVRQIGYGGNLYLNDAEWRMARDALNALRSWRFSVGKGDGGTDDALLRVMSAKYKKAPER
jgi:hypothetical protein